ncbi:MAG: FtsX-like permease family protein [Cyclobacteriaceae bacterium]
MLPYVGVRAISLSRTIPGERSSIWEVNLGEAYQHSTIDRLQTDNDYAAVYGLELLAGAFDTDDGYVISEQAAEILGYHDPVAAVGQIFRDDRNLEHRIHGVVKDYHHYSFQYESCPLIFGRDDLTYQLDSYYSIRVAANNLDATLEQIKSAYEKVFPYDTFEYYFIDSYFDAQYQEDIRFSQLFGTFSGLTIFIACLGLFGLSLHTVVEKTKEIGIRKVLGASVQSILRLLSWDFIRWVCIAGLLALPVAYQAMQMWLANYALRIEMSWWLFLLPLGIVLLIALLTVSVQTMKAALANPADSLRYE